MRKSVWIVFALLAATISGCSDDSFNQSKFNELEAEFLSSASQPVVLTTSDGRELSFDPVVYFACRTPIKNAEAQYFVLRSSFSGVTNQRSLEALNKIRELESKSDLTESQSRVLDITKQYFLTLFSGYEVDFQITSIGARGKSHWMGSARSGAAYLNYLDPASYDVDLDQTLRVLEGDLESGVISVGDQIFRVDMDSKTVYLLDDSRETPLTCYSE